MTLLIERAGILTTVQDLGRTGRRSLGINPGGAMDRAAVRILNAVLGNDEGEAVLEMHYPGPGAVFEARALFAVGGADLAPMLNGEPLRMWTTVNAAPGDRLSFAEPRQGARAYLAISGGFGIEEWLGSKSTNLLAAVGGFEGRRLKAGDRLSFGPRAESGVPGITAGRSIVPHYSPHPTVRVLPGAEFALLTAKAEAEFREGSFTVTNDSNRMGYRLAGPRLHLLNRRELLSAAVDFGTVQLMPDGGLTVLMADHQTTGGYPRIAGVIEPDLSLLAQLMPGDKIAFHPVDTEEAERVALAHRRDLTLLKNGVLLRRR